MEEVVEEEEDAMVEVGEGAAAVLRREVRVVQSSREELTECNIGQGWRRHFRW